MRPKSLLFANRYIIGGCTRQYETCIQMIRYRGTGDQRGYYDCVPGELYNIRRAS